MNSSHSSENIFIQLFLFSTAPDSPPSNVMATSQSSTEILVTWDVVPPIDQNGVITMYQVLYQPLQTFEVDAEMETVNVSAAFLSVVLNNLQEYVEYNISVRAYTSVEAGLYSTGIVERTFEDGNAFNHIF